MILKRAIKPTLGIWDGHDAGIALLDDDQIVFAINEERLSRRKLDVGFPSESLRAMMKYCGIVPGEIGDIAVSTTDFSKTLTRLFPSLRRRYYLIRRRKLAPGPLTSISKLAKYKLTEIPPSLLSRAVSKHVLRRQLAAAGFACPRLHFVDHHAAHAATAAFCSGYDDCLVLTIDGIGDGLSGSVWSFKRPELKRLVSLDGRHSLGIFFEHVTNLLNMRELEDEGKVMALANYAYPLPDKENPLLSFVAVDGLRTKCRFGPLRLRHELAKVLWRYAPEQFAYMAQRTLEIRLIELVRNALKATGHSLVAYAGGVASNVKANMLIQELPEVSGLFIFPHMGDGGLAAGAALWHNFKTYGVSKVRLDNVFLGPDYNKDQIKEALSRYPELEATTLDDLPKRAAELICEGEIIMWFQGRMEYGPRALGGRSILALPGSHEIRDLLNLKLKRRVWYQPFCPTMLEEEAKQVLSNYRGPPNPFMTSAYRVHPSRRNLLQGTMSIDGTCRPQIIPSNVTGKFIDLLTSIKQKTGFGIVLNTSFNLHGEPLVCSPNDALRTFVETEINYLFINDLVVIKPRNINVV